MGYQDEQMSRFNPDVINYCRKDVVATQMVHIQGQVCSDYEVLRSLVEDLSTEPDSIEILEQIEKLAQKCRLNLEEVESLKEEL